MTTNHYDSAISRQIAEAVTDFQMRISGHAPQAVSVVLSEDTLVITLHEALSPAEKVLAGSAEGASQLQEFHRRLFAASSESLRERIHKITGRHVRQSVAEVEPTTGSIVHAFTTGTMVQVFLLSPTHSHQTTADTHAILFGDGTQKLGGNDT